MKPDFKEAFDFPLHRSIGGIVFTKDYHRAFDFMIDLPDEKYDECVAIINDEKEPEKPHIYTRERGLILIDGKPFMRIRNWGYLTGSGGLHLDINDAYKLQCDFGDYVIERLTLKE